ncbi:MAG: bifunctional phosphopantothenoylcysteine decarboxylase/phosphopantothenate--cysteine ligase CoaBC [Epsilonproteobacteria bacterium]|nr:bifunctional phosphopantothenoylcysteine decarboxylase/phosphopantothenate--cysteine ligase CoaBC [Campylobacterota bacterium]
MYRGKKVVMGITGGIAAYKAFELIRELKNEGIDVYAAMTNSAIELIGYQTIVVLTEHPVFKNLFDRIHIHGSATDITHVALGSWADCFIVLPATNHIVSKLASGAGDDPVSLVALASDCPRIAAPTANSVMYQRKTNRRNLEILRQDDWITVEATEGNLACNQKGVGHIANSMAIKEAIYGALEEKILNDFYIVVTAGPTRENIDPVRFISNPSSGKMGFAIAKMAKRMGAEVSLIHGQVQLSGCFRTTTVATTSQMKKAVHREIKTALATGKKVVFISAAAPADFRSEYSGTKIKKDGNPLLLKLMPTEDILKSTLLFSDKIVRVGFAAETGNLMANAKKKLTDKNLDLIVANDITLPGTGFASDNNIVTILGKNIDVKLPFMSKEKAAKKLLKILKEQCDADHNL